MSTKGVVNIRGKEYRTVALRVSEFRKDFSIAIGWSINTIVLEMNEHHAFVKAFISDPDNKVVATGHAVELWGDGQVNSTSALENAETSAIGRALAAAGWGGEEYASADELANALKAQGEGDVWTSGEAEKRYEPPVVKVEEEYDGPDIGALHDEVASLAGKISDVVGEDLYLSWHTNMLRNVCGLEGDTVSVTDVTNVDALVILIDGQKEKLKEVSG